MQKIFGKDDWKQGIFFLEKRFLYFSIKIGHIYCKQ